MFGLKPCAESGVVNLRPALPEIRFQPALDSQMAQLKLDVLRAFGKVTPHIVLSDVEGGNAATFAVCFYDDKAPTLQDRMGTEVEQRWP